MFLDFPKSRKEWDIAFPLWEKMGEKLEKVKITNKKKQKKPTKNCTATLLRLQIH